MLKIILYSLLFSIFSIFSAEELARRAASAAAEIRANKSAAANAACHPYEPSTSADAASEVLMNGSREETTVKKKGSTLKRRAKKLVSCISVRKLSHCRTS